MSDSTVGNLPNAGSLALTDFILSVVDPGGSPVSSHATLAVLAASLKGTTAGFLAAGDDPRFSFATVPSGTENYKAAFNPFNPVYAAIGNGADDYSQLAQCFADAIGKANATVYISQTIEVSKTVNIPVAGFKLPYIVSVDTSTSTLTLALEPGGSNGDPIQWNGSVPTGLTKQTQYYRYFPDLTNLKKVRCYKTKETALAGGATGLVAITGTVTTTGSITVGTNVLTVAAELHDEAGTNVIVNGVSGASGGLYIIGGIGTGTLYLNTTATGTASSATVTYVAWVDGHSFDGGLQVECAPGAFIKKHPTFTTIQGNSLIRGAIGSDIQLINCNFEGLSSQFIPLGVVATVAGTNQVTITSGSVEWAQPGTAFALGGGAVTYYVNSVTGNVITAHQTSTGSPSWPSGTFTVGQGLSSGLIGITATGSTGTNTATLNSVDGLFNGLTIYFGGDTAGGHVISAINTSTKVVTFSVNLAINITNACVVSIGGDDGLDLSSVRHGLVSFCSFRHCGDAALRMQSNVAYYGARTASDVNGGVNTSQIAVQFCNFYNIYQISTTTNNYMEGGAKDIHFLYNKFEYLRGSVKFAGRVPGSRNINLIGNMITSSDNHGFECDSQSGLTIRENKIYNVFNQGIFILSNNAPTSAFVLVNTTAASTSVLVDDSSAFTNGQSLTISGVGSFTVAGIPDATHITLNVNATVTKVGAATNVLIKATTTAGSAVVTLTSTALLHSGYQLTTAGVTGVHTILSVDSPTQVTMTTVCDLAVTLANIGIVGLGVVGFQFDGLHIEGNYLDNCGQSGGTSAMRLNPDGYADGTLFQYRNVWIKNNIITNVTNTANVAINLVNGSYIDLRIEGNQFTDYQGLIAIRVLGRGDVTGTINNIRISNNDISLNNASATGVWVERNNGTTNQLNNIQIDGNNVTGTGAAKYSLSGLNNVRITNQGPASLFSGKPLSINSGILSNITIDNEWFLTKTTTTATQTTLLWDGATSTAKPLINNNEGVYFKGRVIGRDSTGNLGIYDISGLIKQGANLASTTLLSSSVTTVYEDTAGWDVALSADTTNGCLNVLVTGATSTTIKWTSKIAILEQF